MVGIFGGPDEACEQAAEYFGDDIAVLVEALLELDGVSYLSNRVYTNADAKLPISEVERWILTKIGLPEWIAPNLNIKLIYCPIKSAFVIAEREEFEDLILSSAGNVIWRKRGVEKVLSSNLLFFLRSVALYSILVKQAMLINGAQALVDNNIPSFLVNSLMESIKSFDPKTDCMIIALGDISGC